MNTGMWWAPDIKIILGAFLIDLFIGDPRWIPHPVVMIGKLISFLEEKLQKKGLSPSKLYLRGVALTFTVLLVTLAAVLSILYLSSLIHPYLYLAVYVWLLAATLAVKGLGQAGLCIYRALKDNNLSLARRKAGEIVGRDTAGLQEDEVSRAAVETVAENTVDGVTAPLIYALIGGLPLAMLYKTVNTLDSMVGYRDEKYEYFGRASAKLDDLANYIPARITALLMLLASVILRLDTKRAWQVLKADARNHPSPNSGFAEALAAGSLGIQLGGVNYYRGKASKRPYLGIKTRQINSGDILSTIKLMHLTAYLTLFFGVLFKLV